MHGEKVAHRKVHDEIHVLGELGHQLLLAGEAGGGVGRRAVDEDAAAGGGIPLGQAFDVAEQPALAAAGGPDDAHHLPRHEHQLALFGRTGLVAPAEHGDALHPQAGAGAQGRHLLEKERQAVAQIAAREPEILEQALLKAGEIIAENLSPFGRGQPQRGEEIAGVGVLLEQPSGGGLKKVVHRIHQ